MDSVLFVAMYALFNAPMAFALGGGSHAGEAASEADSIFPFLFLAALVLVAVIDRLRR